MRRHGLRLKLRADSLRYRILGLAGLRRLVNLAPPQDITLRQWSVLEPQLHASVAQLASRVKTATNQFLPHAADPRARRRLNTALGRIELDVARAYTFFDTYMDVLTQRRSGELGPLLTGCDVLACEAMRRNHPALAAIEPPLVYCDRGFGASIVRESVLFPDGSPNPMPLIQIPYSRLREKCNLTSLLHEAGHQALARLELVAPIGAAVRSALRRSGAPSAVADLCAHWMKEIAPDFWAFCLTGAAEAIAVRDLFALPPGQAFHIAATDPHPPSYLRSLITFDWCRQSWGRGPWDDWQEEWCVLYPLSLAPPQTRALLEQARRHIGVIGQTLFEHRFAELYRQPLTSLFDLSLVAPAALQRVAARASGGIIDLRGLSACTQLALFGRIRQLGIMSEPQLDRLMTQWLQRLGRHDEVMH